MKFITIFFTIFVTFNQNLAFAADIVVGANGHMSASIDSNSYAIEDFLLHADKAREQVLVKLLLLGNNLIVSAISVTSSSDCLLNYKISLAHRIQRDDGVTDYVSRGEISGTQQAIKKSGLCILVAN